MEARRLPNTWKVNVIVGFVLGLALATLTHLYDHRGWLSEYALAGPLMLLWSAIAGRAGRRNARRGRELGTQ